MNTCALKDGTNWIETSRSSGGGIVNVSNTLLGADGDAIAFSASTTAQTFAGCSFRCYAQCELEAAGEPMAGSDADGDGQPIESDRCPLAAGTPLDNDGDQWIDRNDAYACDVARAAADATFSEAALDAFLAGATAASVDGTSC